MSVSSRLPLHVKPSEDARGAITKLFRPESLIGAAGIVNPGPYCGTGTWSGIRWVPRTKGYSMKRGALVFLSLFLPLLAEGCGGGGEGDCASASGSSKAQYVLNTLKMPMTKADYAYDLNGDQRPDNQ